MTKLIYLDNNATTSIAPEVQKEIKRSLKYYANPSSLHFFGAEVSYKLIAARETVAKSIGASVDEIIFTASGSEGNNLCIRGYAEANREKGKHIITTAIEHPSVINTCKHLEEQGFQITYLDVDGEGFVDLVELENSIRTDTILVSVMHVNNEIGSIQKIKSIVEICDKHGVPVHTDAVQSYLKLPFDVSDIGISLATFAGHKIHAPKGVGFIYKKKGIKIRREIDGGSQEFNLRAGTENIPYILGLAKATSLFHGKDIGLMKDLQKYMFDILNKIPSVRVNGTVDFEKRICNNINISFENFEAENILNKLSNFGICVSTGSACSSKSTKVSPVLLAIKCPVEYIHGNLRISLSKYSTKREVNYFVNKLKKILGNVDNQKIFSK